MTTDKILGNPENKAFYNASADQRQRQDPIRQIMSDNEYIEMMRHEDGKISISMYGHAIITHDFLEGMENNGYKLDRIFNGAIVSAPENPKDMTDPTLHEQPDVPPAFIETTIRFEDTKFFPDLETSCKMCGKQEERGGEGSTEDGEENENPSGEGIGDTSSASYHNLTTTADKIVKSSPPPSEEE